MSGSRLARVVRIATVSLGGLLVLAAVAHGVLWWQATGALAREAARWVEARAAEGIAVRHAPSVRGGWPWAARLTLPEVTAEGQVAVQGQGLIPLSLAARAVGIEVALMRPREALITIGSPFTISAGPEIAARGEADALELVVPLRGSADPAARLAGRALAISTGTERFAAAQIALRASRDASARGEAPVLALSLAATGVQLPDSSGAVLGNRVARAELDLQVIGEPPSFGSPHAQAVAWRDAGGFLQVPRLLLDWGPLSLAADATLALDQAVQPSGAGRARIAGLGPTLDALATAGLIPRQAAQAGRGIIAFMQRTPAGGGPPVVELPLTLQDRTLSAGRITLLRLPPILWPR
jgi:hypothetical protein